MARALSTSVSAPRVISVAVAFTIPSVGSSFVGRRKCSNAARRSLGAPRGAGRYDHQPERDQELWGRTLGTAPRAERAPGGTGALSAADEADADRRDRARHRH